MSATTASASGRARRDVSASAGRVWSSERGCSVAHARSKASHHAAAESGRVFPWMQGSVSPETDAPIRVFVVDDHPMVREGLRSLLDDDGIEVVGEAASVA